MSLINKTSRLGRAFAAFSFAAGLVATSQIANAAETDLGTHKDWRALKVTENGQTYCYMISSPKDTNPKGVRRGDINFFVTKVPASKATEVNVQMGYPLADNARGDILKARIGSTNLRFTTKLQDGWAETKDVPTLIKSMKRGSSMQISGTSRRGTKTSDTYSLSGFTAAYNAISKACNM